MVENDRSWLMSNFDFMMRRPVKRSSLEEALRKINQASDILVNSQKSESKIGMLLKLFEKHKYVVENQQPKNEIFSLTIKRFKKILKS